MPEKQVPLVDAGMSGIGSDPASQQVEITNRLLEAEARTQEFGNRDVNQRYWLRWGTISTTLVVIMGMGYLLAHVAHHLMPAQMMQVATSYLIALMVAPIVSITTLTLALLVAAFRKFQDSDEKMGTEAASQTARASGILN